MEKYNILWVDDQIKTNTIFTLIKNQLDVIMSSDVKLNFVECKTAAEGVADLLSNKTDIHLAILDIRLMGAKKDIDFETDSHVKYSIADLIKNVQQKNISYIIYSNFPDDIDDFKHLIDPFFLVGKVKKNEADLSEILNSIFDLFKAPPFRILQLGDLHYDWNLKGDKMEEQKYLFDTLNTTISKINETTPIDYLVFNGDLACKTPEKDLLAIRSIVMSIIKSTIGIPNIDRALIVPGNHDIYWSDFLNGILSNEKWQHYLEFYQAIFSTKQNILSEIKAWDTTTNLFNYNCSGTSLSFCRTFRNNKLSFVGISSTSEFANEKGCGRIEREHEKFIANKWANRNNSDGSYRICILHHNILIPVSLNANDEKTQAANPGNLLHVLLHNDCNLILTAHTHTINANELRMSIFNSRGFSDLKHIKIISTGTVNGYQATLDRPRMFNLINISRFDMNLNKRDVRVTPFYYDSTSHVWEELQNYVIL